MIQGLIFDFDGLIIDTETPALQSWQEIYADYACDLPMAVWALCLGGAGTEFDPCAYLEEQTGQLVDHAALNARRQQRKGELVRDLAPLPGVREYLEAATARGLKIGLASSSRRDWVISHLERLGLRPYFSAVAYAEDVARVKPAPDLYQTVLAALQLTPAQVIALEDSPNGVRAAQAAGLFCVAVPNGITGQLPLDHANLRLTALSDLPLDDLLAVVHRQQARSTAHD